MNITALSPAIAAAALAAILAACSADEPALPGETPGVKEVEVTVALGSAWDIEPLASRDAPPGTGIHNGGAQSGSSESDGADGSTPYDIRPDRVRIIAFRRPDPDIHGSGYDEPFTYDVTNDRIASLTSTTSPNEEGIFTDIDDTHIHLTARGTLRKVYGYEYRVIAVAYSAGRTSAFPLSLPSGEQQWMSLNTAAVPTLDDFQATVASHQLKKSDWSQFFQPTSSDGVDIGIDKHLSHSLVDTPQLFYGECHSRGKASPVKYFEPDPLTGEESDEVGLHGILYRGMAKVELHITPTDQVVGLVHYPVKWITLMADNVPTSTALTDYDSFLTPSGHITGGYTPIGHISVGGSGEAVITAYLLPTATRLAVRIHTVSNASALNYTRDALLTTVNTVTTGDNATGIISPDYHDEIFYLRRNHQYILRVADSEKLLTNHSL